MELIKSFDTSIRTEKLTSLGMVKSVMEEKDKYFKQKINYMQMKSSELSTYSYRELKEFNRIIISGEDYFKYGREFHKKHNHIKPINAVGMFFDKIEKVQHLFFNKIAFVIDYRGYSNNYDYLYFVFEKVEDKMVLSVYSTKNGFGAKHRLDLISYKDEETGKLYYFNVFSDENYKENITEKEMSDHGERACFIIYTLLEINEKLANRKYTKKYINNSSNNSTTKKTSSNTNKSTKKTVYNLDDLLNTKIYINNRDNFRLPRGYNRKTESWNVMGYYRHYKDGRVVFVKPHVRGDKSKKVTGRTIKLS